MASQLSPHIQCPNLCVLILYVKLYMSIVLYGDDSCSSQLQSLAENLQLAGVEGQRDGKLCSSGEGGTDGKDLPVCNVSLAPPMIVGAWSMAVVLWQYVHLSHSLTVNDGYFWLDAGGLHKRRAHHNGEILHKGRSNNLTHPSPSPCEIWKLQNFKKKFQDSI